MFYEIFINVVSFRAFAHSEDICPFCRDQQKIKLFW